MQETGDSGMINALLRLRSKVAIVDNWRAARLTRTDCTILVATVVICGYFRGLDYSYGNDSAPAKPIDGRPPTVFLLSEVLPLQVYGAAICLLLTALIVGWLVRWHQMIWWSHGLCMVLWAMLFVGTLVPIFHIPYLDGLRGATSLVSPIVIHTLFWIRTGPTPLLSQDGRTIETMRRPNK